MKWIIEKDEELKKLILEYKNYEEIAKIMGVTKRSVTNRCYRLGLKIIKNKEYECKNCGNTFIDSVKSNRKFCSKSCANTFNSLGRKHSNETKNKISEKLYGQKRSDETKEKISGENNPNWKGGITNKIIKKDGKRKCKYCEEFNIDKKRNLICDNCKFNYYKLYRPECEFNFDIIKYKDWYDFKLVEVHGWYSPSNKGNNLNGVSRDHKFSVKDGFINKIDPKIISHPANCELMIHGENSSKNDKSSITLKELKKLIELWDGSINRL